MIATSRTSKPGFQDKAAVAGNWLCQFWDSGVSKAKPELEYCLQQNETYSSLLLGSHYQWEREPSSPFLSYPKHSKKDLKEQGFDVYILNVYSTPRYT